VHPAVGILDICEDVDSILLDTHRAKMFIMSRDMLIPEKKI